jgi:hypothetical protein
VILGALSNCQSCLSIELFVRLLGPGYCVGQCLRHSSVALPSASLMGVGDYISDIEGDEARGEHRARSIRVINFR